jgi:poly(hydroxyalkanoate) depolymerase family esterase
MAMNIQDTIDRALNSAGLNTRSGPFSEVSETIRQALASAGLAPAAGATPRSGPPDTIDVQAREIPPNPLPPDSPLPTPQPPTPPTPGRPPAPQAPGGKGRFLTRTYQGSAGTRVYKVYVPVQARTGTALPLVLMLHGCTQNADDFAAGTQMNALADVHGFVVAYPEQASGANASRCWNWFRAEDQLRNSGEPAILAGIVQAVQREYPVDPTQVFVAGLSAGAAMAVILGETYPDLFAAVGAHSGLPYAAAHDVSSALAAMKGRAILGRSHLPGTPDDPRRPTRQAVPLIVFHGDRDHTVQHSNGQHIVQQVSQAYAAAHKGPGAVLNSRSESGIAAGGRRFTRTLHSEPGGHTLVEDWTLHGAGHAWSGGSPAGSYTDPAGPDASAEMLRFFLLVAAHAIRAGVAPIP